jgi:malonyl-CoA decarboxylase
VEDLTRDFPRIRNFATVSPVPGFRRWLAGAFADALTLFDEMTSIHDAARQAELERRLAPLCAYYLLRAKQANDEPLDAVARFHLKNGARLERINWLGDSSAAGLQRSVGFSANYVYRLQDLERNHELYVREHKVRASREIEALAKKFNPPSRF